MSITLSDGFCDLSGYRCVILHIFPKQNQKENLRGCLEQPILASGSGCSNGIKYFFLSYVEKNRSSAQKSSLKIEEHF